MYKMAESFLEETNTDRNMQKWAFLLICVEGFFFGPWQSKLYDRYLQNDPLSQQKIYQKQISLISKCFFLLLCIPALIELSPASTTYLHLEKNTYSIVTQFNQHNASDTETVSWRPILNS